MKALDKTLMEALAKGVFEYINTILSVIPVWSGASRATFLQLATIISFSIPIESVAWTGTGEKNHPGHAAALNRISLGAQCGTGRLIIDATAGKYHFEYTNDLHYLTFNEYNDANQGGDSAVFSRLKRPGPYHFQAKGAAAFEKSARETHLPNPWDHVKISVSRYGSRTIL